MSPNILRQLFLALFLFTFVAGCFADSRVFDLVSPHPEAILQSLRDTYGDKLQANIARGKLVVVGTPRQLDEIAALLVKLDPAPRPLHLTLTETPPDNGAGTITYTTGGGGYAIDTVENTLVALDYSKIAQQPTSGNGWWITVENKPTRFTSLTLQVKLEGGRRAIVRVSYEKEDQQQRRVFANTVVGDLGTWIPLLPRPLNAGDDGTVSSGPKRGQQLYLRVERQRDYP